MKTTKRPTLLEVEAELRTVKKVSWVLSLFLTLFFLLIFPVICVSFNNYNLTVFTFWIIIGQIFIFIAFIFLLIGPLFESYFIEQFNLLLAKLKSMQKQKPKKVDPKKQVVVKLEEPDDEQDNNYTES